MSERQTLELIGKRIGNYVVEQNLARGAMGTVCIARHPTLKRQVAVKFIGLDEEIPEDHQRRFLDEACITANLRHPNIVDIFDFGELDGRLYYVMELLQGRDLAALIRHKRRFDVPALQTFVTQICAGLHAAHAVGIVHRDLKPSNIFVLEGEPIRIKLMDFGVAKVMSGGGDRTHQGQIIGTPRYMSPEQALGQVDRITPQSDIYSLGIILYEMLTGRPVFEHDSPMMLLVMHIRDEVRPIRGANPAVPLEIAQLIESCLAKRPEERPKSARDIAERFDEILRLLPQIETSNSVQSEPSPSSDVSEGPPPAVTIDGRERVQAETVGELQQPAPAFNKAESSSAKPARKPPPPVRTARREETPAGIGAKVSSAAAAVGEAIAAATLENLGARRDSPKPEDELSDVELVYEDDEPKAPSGSPTTMAAALVPEVKLPVRHEGGPSTIRLTKSDRDTLNKLWTRMQRGGDFPAFVRNVGEVSKRADFEGAYSATQLSDSILKDFALTAKLLRVVNSTYANRFGGKVYSVQHAIVILGFDRVRSLALSISLFKKKGSEEHEQKVSDSAIHSLASGELSQQLAPLARVFDEEQAMMCGMFRNLGRHLVVVYLPEMYDQMLALAESEQMSQSAAAERVFGLSLQKIGLGVAEKWRLPKPILRTMSAIAHLGGSSAREEDRVVELADFSNELCDIVMNCPEQQRQAAITNLLVRHKNLINLDQDQIAETLQQVRQSFEQRYASLVGVDAKNSRFSRNVATMVSNDAASEVPNHTESRLQVNEELMQHASAANAGAIRVAVPAQPARPKPQAQRIQLAKVTLDAGQSPTNKNSEIAEANDGSKLLIQQQIAEFAQKLSIVGRDEKLLNRMLRFWAQQLNISKCVVLRANAAKNELVVAGGLHPELDALVKEFKVAISPAKTSSDVFSQAFFQSKDVIIEDTYSAKASTMLPVRYYEVIGAPTTALYPCVCKGRGTVLLLVDAESPSDLPSAEENQKLVELRPLVACAIS